MHKQKIPTQKAFFNQQNPQNKDKPYIKQPNPLNRVERPNSKYQNNPLTKPSSIKAMDVPGEYQVLVQDVEKLDINKPVPAHTRILNFSSFSKVQQIKQSALKPLQYYSKHNKIQPHILSRMSSGSIKRQNVSNLKASNKSQLAEVEKVPCAFCDKLITFQQMQVHHNNCQFAFTCKKCHDIFPSFLIDQHELICQGSVSKVRNREPSYLKYYKKHQSNYKVPKHQEIDEDQLYQLQLIEQHPQIDPEILRQHLRAEKENWNHPHNYELYDQKYEEFGDDANQENQYIDQPEYSFQKSKIIQGLRNSEMEDLITDFYHRGENNSEEECSICTKEKEQGDIVIRLPCFHVFHKECIVPWLEVKSICPTCKYKIK